MKTFRFLALALLAGAMGFVSCDNDEVGEEGNKEYLFAAGCHILDVDGDETGEIKEQQHDIVNAALAKVGFTGESDYPLSITGKDSASVSKVLLEKMAQVEKAIANAPVHINAELDVKGAEKSIVNSDDKDGRIVNTWYEKTFGVPSNASYDKASMYNLNARLYVKWLRTRGWHNWEKQGTYWTEICYDLNKGAGGDYIYLVFEHSGKYGEKYVWENQFEGSYITDVIAVKDHDAPKDLYVKDKGRWYHREEGVCNLNAGAGGEHIRLYATREKIKDVDGRYYYLTTGRIDKGTSTCLKHSSDNFTLTTVSSARTADLGHMTLDRIVPLYDKNGDRKDLEADLNKGAGGKYIKLVLTYATKETGY